MRQVYKLTNLEPTESIFGEKHFANSNIINNKN